jgi:methylglyoxal synthase
MIERNALDLVIFFYNPNMISKGEPDMYTIVSACDRNNIPVATNIGTAEVMVLGLSRGDLDWRLGLKSSDIV